MTEIYKVYKNFYNHFTTNRTHVIEVSNLGNVKVDGELVDFSKRKTRAYYQVFNLYVHRMVAETFIPNPDNKPMVDHINTNRLDNRVDNLRWVTSKENCNNPLTLIHNKDSFSEERRKEIRRRTKQYADAHPEWKEAISTRNKGRIKTEDECRRIGKGVHEYWLKKKQKQ